MILKTFNNFDIHYHYTKQYFAIVPNWPPYSLTVKVEVKAVFGSYSTDALRYVVLLPE